MTRACVFAGPTLWGEAVPAGVARFGPAAMGSVFRAAQAGYRRVGIVDGVFGNVPSVWHKEILWALANGVEVVGAASMGALRAAELHRFGMTGIGRIYRIYRSGRWTDDDEVAVTHADEYLRFRPLSEPMCNIRWTLRNMRRTGVIDAPGERELACAMKSRHFSQRSRETLVEGIGRREEAARIGDAFSRYYVDIKKQDARALLAYFSRRPRLSARRDWSFPATGHWRKQFERDIADVPPLR